MQFSKKQGNDCHYDTDKQTSGNSADNISGKYDDVWYRGNQHFFNMSLKFSAEERRHHIGVTVINDGHHNQPWCNELNISKTLHLTDSGSDQVAENQKIQRHADGRRDYGL